ncbi:hypothetical protein HN51_059467 [Arachis hypogaea]|nr:ABC transporter G family member 15-like [Arachis ipaensis]QHN82875.1 ABC transporter G family member [Arachis hypogaea]
MLWLNNHDEEHENKEKDESCEAAESGASEREDATDEDVPNSADPFMNMATAQIKAMLVDRYRRSTYATRAKDRIQELSTNEGLENERQNGSQATWWKQLRTLTKRSFVNMCKDVGYYWLRIIIYIIVSICVGTIYFDIGYSYTSILARVACGAFISGFMTFMSIGGFPSFIEEMKLGYYYF